MNWIHVYTAVYRFVYYENHLEFISDFKNRIQSYQPGTLLRDPGFLIFPVDQTFSEADWQLEKWEGKVTE